MQFTTSILALIALSVPLIEAHTAFTTFFVDGVSQGEGTCVRMNMDASKATFPIPDITSTDMTCGIDGLSTVARTCPVKAGSTVSFQYRSYPDGTRPGVIAVGHSGPCAIYMKKVSSGPVTNSFPTTDPTGDGWFKIMYEDYDGKQWCTDKLAEATMGIISAVIPSDLSSGYYLLRPELLALHQAASLGNPQFYTGCAQVYIDGGSGTAKPETVSIPGYVNYQTPAMKYNLYSQPLSLPYPAFGPPVYKSGSSSSKLKAREPCDGDNQQNAAVHAAVTVTKYYTATAAATTIATAATTVTTIQNSAATVASAVQSAVTTAVQDAANTATQNSAVSDAIANTTTWGCPDNTVLVIGNWCGVEIPSYSDSSDAMTNCWAASKSCWNQGQTCWNGGFSPAINNDPGHGCSLWNDRCTAINNACEAHVMSGPPDQGKVLTPAPVHLTGYGIEKRDEIRHMVAEHRAGRMRRNLGRLSK